MRRELVLPFILFAMFAWSAIFYALSGNGAACLGWACASLLAFDNLWRKR